MIGKMQNVIDWDESYRDLENDVAELQHKYDTLEEERSALRMEYVNYSKKLK